MKRKTLISVLLASFCFASLYATEAEVRPVCSLPESDSWKSGLAGAYIGRTGSGIVIAGGSDFIGLPPWEGGTKSYSSAISVLSVHNGQYSVKKSAASLPYGMAGGCSVSDGSSLYILGGVTDEGKWSDAVLRIKSDNETFSTDTVGYLPENFRTNAAILYKGEVYAIGAVFPEGEEAAVSFQKARLSDFSEGKDILWRPLAAFGGAPVSEGSAFVRQHNGYEDAMYLFGGRHRFADGSYRLGGDIWEYLPSSDSWSLKGRMTTEKGENLTLMYSSAFACGSAHIILMGGDDGVEFLRRADVSEDTGKGRRELDSLFVNHKGFGGNVYAWHTITSEWYLVDSLGISLPAVTSAIECGSEIIIPSGELRPGVRTPEILSVKIKDTAHFSTLNYVIIILYLGAMLAVGFYFSRRSKSTEQFFKGGSSIPWWVAGISIFATALSAITFLSIPAKSYATDWNMFLYNMMIPLVVPVVIVFYLPFFRKLNVASAYQYLEDRFSGKVRLLASAFFCLFMFARVAIVLFLPSLALNAVTGLNVYLCILMMGVVTVIYCTMGGIEAVVWGDVIQGVILVGGAILSLCYLFSGVDGGFDAAMSIARENGKFNIFDFSTDWSRPVFWVVVIGGFANQFLTYSSDQSVVQRYITVKDSAAARKGIWLNGLLSIPIAVVFFAIGTGLFVFFKEHPQLLNATMSNTDSIYPHYMMTSLPDGLAGLLISAVFAAAMSTLSANINSASTVMTEDFYRRIRPKADDRMRMKFARRSGLAVGGLGIVMALCLATFDIASLWDQFNFFLGLLTSGIGGLFMMGIFTKRIGPKAALTGFISVVVILICLNYFSDISFLLYGAIGLASSFIIAWLSSFLWGRKV